MAAAISSSFLASTNVNRGQELLGLPLLFPCKLQTASKDCRGRVAVRSIYSPPTLTTRISQEVDTKSFRRDLMKSETYNKSGFGLKEETRVQMSKDYKSDIVKTLRENNYEYSWGNVTIKLAKAFGFCWGVERAIQMAYETRKQFRKERIWITNEIIHNLTVNKKLEDMGIHRIPVVSEGVAKDFGVVERGDVVIVPGAGACLHELQALHAKKVQIVDTTCPWVAKVWNSIEKHKKASYTSVIHGKKRHDETMATASFASHFIIVENIKEAFYVCDYILGGKLDGSSGSKEQFLEKFRCAISKGFDPDIHLVCTGIANQTTMLKRETEMIGKLFEKTMMKKYGVENLNDHFMSFNTICGATQERQNAMYDLIKEKLDMMLVVGGWNSSNTSHLQLLGELSGIPSYWVDDAEKIGPGNRIAFKLHHGEYIEKEIWLPRGPLIIGVTSGASTPDKVINDVLKKVFELKQEEVKL